MLGPLEEVLAKPDGDVPPGQARAGVDVAHRNGVRLLKLVNSLLDFSRIEAGRVAGDATSRSISPRSPPSSPRTSARRSSGPALRLRIDAPPLGAAGLCRSRHVGEDRPQPALERLQVHLRRRDRASTVERDRRRRRAPSSAVRDTGIGIPAAELPHLFERFHRVEGARGRTFEGSGIGLALVQELVKLHGGTIAVESERRPRQHVHGHACRSARAHLPPDRLDAAARAGAQPTCARRPIVEEALRWLGGSVAGDRAASRRRRRISAYRRRAADAARAARPARRRQRRHARLRRAACSAGRLRGRGGRPTAQAALEAARRQRPDLDPVAT